MKSKNFLLSPENLPMYLEDKKLVKDANDCVVRELGGGVSNIVLLVEWPDDPERRWVVKQSLGKLRVKDDWRSDRERIFREADAIHMLRPILGNALPEVIYKDQRNFLYIMTAAPRGSQVWKESLLACRLSDLSVAREVGLLLARLINSTAASSKFELWFHQRTNFDQLRINPYYRTTALRQANHPQVQTALRKLITDSLKIQTSLVHGDYSPKNILVHGKDIFLIDFEVVHWGDPSFDAGFLLNHLFLKAFHRPQFASIYFDAVREFWKALHAGLGLDETGDFETMTIRHLGGLMLARIDGKSPVEYINDEKTKARVRKVGKSILLVPPSNMNELVAVISNEF
ncbi:MAG TPA: aminoglycoside phosphotransferase family protein [Terriglobia bacterium]|nr:aminoglycoside phosphotransferase family protein [Terriglobia bacterium]